MLKLVTVSMNRYNGGVRAKRQYGSSTITIFYVYRYEDRHMTTRWVTVETGGKTPGDRAAAAKKKAEPLIVALLAKEGIVP